MRKSFGVSRASLYKFLITISVVLISTLAQPAFAEDEKKLFGFIDWLNGKYEKICNLVHPGSPVKAPVKEAPKQIQGPPPPPTENEFKNDRELDLYLKCYATEDGRYDQIAKEYMPIIETAAKNFGLPKSLLACLMFRESRFNIHAKSGSGAYGLGQHLAGTMKDITRVIQPMNEKIFEKLTGDVKLSPEDYVKKYKTTHDQAVEDIGVAQARLTNQKLRIDWENYYEALKKKNLVKGETPRLVNRTTLADPKIAIGATAFYLKTIMVYFRDRLDSDIKVANHDHSNPNFDILLTAAGAYNIGPGAAAKILNPIDPPDRKAWIQALKHSNEETAGHMVSIERCLQTTGSPDGNAWKGPIGSPRLDCSPENAGKVPPVILLAKETLPAEYLNKIKSATLKAPKVKAEKKSKSEKKQTSKPATTKSKKKKKDGDS